MGSGTLAKTLVGVLVGGGATMVVGYAGSKVDAIAKYPLITPALLIGIGLLLARRGRMVAGFSLIGAGAAILGLQALVKMGSMSSGDSKPAQTAGAGHAGDRLTDSGGAGGTFGNREILNQQNAMGDLHNAGAFFGLGGRQLLAQQNAMG